MSVTSIGRLWGQIQRGWEATRPKNRTLNRIAEWSWPFWSETPQTVPVHLLAGEKDWWPAAWALASWFHYSEHAWPVVIHDDGTLPAEAPQLFKKLFPSVRIIDRREADAAVEPTLRSYPFCADYRRLHPLAFKLFDVPHFTTGEHFLVFNSGLLFFNHPGEIMEWVKAQPPECRLQRDFREGSLLTAVEARDELGTRLWPRAHAGLALIHKPAFNLDFCDRAIAQTSLLNGDPGRSVNTLIMICAAAQNRGGLLSPNYVVSDQKVTVPGFISIQYTGQSRERLYAEAIEQLLPALLPAEE